MIPAQFDYVAPATLDEAVALLSQHSDEAKILAGGHSLIPAMKLRLAMPQLLIDIGRIKDLSYIREDGGQIRIGAMTTHYAIESSDRLREVCPILPETAAQIGDVQVRNKGTIGGSVAHSDPAADWPAALLALDAEVVAVSGSGERTIKIEEFFVDLLTTALEPGEILREIRFNAPSGRYGQAYLKMPQPASGFAVVGCAVHLVKGGDDRCESIKIAITGVASKAYRATSVSDALVGDLLADDSEALKNIDPTRGVDVNGDLFASAEYRRHLAAVYTRRAVKLAAQRAM